MADKGNSNNEAVQEAAAGATAAPVENSVPTEIRTITLTGYGGIRNAKIQKKPQVEPKEGEVLIRVKACGVNFGDLMMRQGAIDNPPKTPFTLGFECSGEVESLGENVEGFEIGDRVVAITDLKAWAETVPVSIQYVYKLPTGMSFQDGAAFLINYVTAYILLFDIGNIRKGQSVLMHSAGGGVGLAIGQLSKTVEDVTIFGTASYNKHDALKNHVTHLLDHVVDYCQEVRKLSPEGVDLVLDCLCGEDTNKGITILKPMGKYVLYGTANVVTGETKSFFSFAKSWWQVDKVNPLKLFDENKSVCGLNIRQLLFKQGRHEYVRDIVTTLFKWYNEGKIRPVVDSVWAFEDIGEAMQKMHDRKNIGKLLLDPSLEPKEKETKADKPAENPEENNGADKDGKKEGSK